MTANLKQLIWEAHPYLPRIKKLKLVKFLPIGYERILLASEILGYPSPEPYDPLKCSITDDVVDLRSHEDNRVGDIYAGDKSGHVNELHLVNGLTLSEHDYNLLLGKTPNESGFIPGCLCLNCKRNILQQALDHEDDRMNQFQTRPVIVGISPEEKIFNVSPDVAERLSLGTAPITKQLPKIISYHARTI